MNVKHPAIEILQAKFDRMGIDAENKKGIQNTPGYDTVSVFDTNLEGAFDMIFQKVSKTHRQGKIEYSVIKKTPQIKTSRTTYRIYYVCHGEKVIGNIRGVWSAYKYERYDLYATPTIEQVYLWTKTFEIVERFEKFLKVRYEDGKTEWLPEPEGLELNILLDENWEPEWEGARDTPKEADE